MTLDTIWAHGDLSSLEHKGNGGTVLGDVMKRGKNPTSHTVAA